MTELRHVQTWSGGPDSHGLGITALVSSSAGSGLWLHTANGTQGGLMEWAVTAAPVRIDIASFAPRPGLPVPTGLEPVSLGGKALLAAHGLPDQGIVLYDPAPGALLSGAVVLPLGGATVLAVQTVALGQGRDLILTTAADVPGITTHLHTASGQVSTLATVSVGGGIGGYDLVDMAVVTPAGGGAPILLALSARDHGLTSLVVGADGSLTAADRLGPAEGHAVSTPTAVRTVILDGRDFAIVAAAGTSSVSVVEVAADGTLALRDQVNDSLDTRFQSASHLEVAQVGERVFVVVAGADDGITLLQLLPDGRLLHVASLADSTATAMDGISALSVTVRDGGLDIFVTSWNDTGITRLRADVGPEGVQVQLGAQGVTHQGGAGNDVILGGAGADRIAGGHGDDVVVDGAGSDRLSGGPGADVFVLRADGVADRIEDFEVGVDRLDLSGWGRLYGRDALSFTPTPTGLVIRFGTERLQLDSSDGRTIDPGRLSDADLFDLWHVAIDTPATGVNQMLRGADANDILLAGPGHDRLVGGRGNDTLRGGDGNDRLLGETAEAGHETAAAQVFRLYQTMLGRSPDIGGHSNWTEQLETGRISLAEMTERFRQSAEFQGTYGNLDTPAFLTLLYANVLGRAPDPTGLAGWSAALDGGRLSPAEVAMRFSESPEFQNRSQAEALAFTPAAYQAGWADEVFRLYGATLGRVPDAGGFANWTAVLAEGRPILDAISGFVGSAEFRATYGATSDAQFVALLYNNVLGRSPDAAGFAGWTGVLAQGSLSREEVVLRFAQSAEYVALSAPRLEQWLRGQGDNDVLAGGAGDDILFGGLGSDRFVFARDEPGRDVVADLEAWDSVQLNGFGYDDIADVLARSRMVDGDLVFTEGDVQIVFLNTAPADLSAAMFDFG